MKTYIVDEYRELHHNAKRIEYIINENDCHICISHSCNEKGYPMKNVNGKNTTMIRYLWLLHTGIKLKSNEFCCHKCDNPQCININHLFIGSNDDNVKDKVSKKRQVRHSNLSNEDVLRIKTNIENTSTELSEMYNVSGDTIRKIWNEKTYKYIEVENYETYKEKRRNRVSESKKNNALIARESRLNKGRD
ncbi:endonuclease [Bacillus phage vB_BanS_Sophrita]|uniref:HNH endonuclease n=1 Tax=Bacillus phage vB_BanS_Sophrita TaxID=2894790 RepID=A0AAE8YVQ2_9CAUD|nr:endonuclease [Bacillus phage vB_BanS_Sophrita]UGO50823.1 HNH endonuclease [Bacillus phage vB_BanS_Sophrita]